MSRSSMKGFVTQFHVAMGEKWARCEKKRINYAKRVVFKTLQMSSTGEFDSDYSRYWKMVMLSFVKEIKIRCTRFATKAVMNEQFRIIWLEEQRRWRDLDPFCLTYTKSFDIKSWSVYEHNYRTRMMAVNMLSRQFLNTCTNNEEPLFAPSEIGLSNGFCKKTYYEYMDLYENLVEANIIFDKITAQIKRSAARVRKEQKRCLKFAEEQQLYNKVASSFGKSDYQVFVNDSVQGQHAGTLTGNSDHDMHNCSDLTIVDCD